MEQARHGLIAATFTSAGSPWRGGYWRVNPNQWRDRDSAAVTVWSTGTLYGNGFVQTNEVANQGTVTPDQTISVTGNLTFNSTASMSSTVTPDTAASVTAQGTAALNGSLNVTLKGGPFIQGTQYTLLLANGELNSTTLSTSQ